MTPYPHVLDEQATLDLVLSGRSIARYGDGEFKVCWGGAIKSQPADARLAAALRSILQDSGDCLVGIPNIESATPKADFWVKYRTAANLLNPARAYVSAFISRPDSAPWINTEAYWAKVRQFWVGRDITIVRGSGKAFTSELTTDAREVTEVLAPKYGAWSDYKQLIDRIGHPDRVLLSLGPTATVLAVELCAKGIHAIDVGHMGSFYRRWSAPLPVEAVA